MKSSSIINGIKYNWELRSMKQVEGRYRFSVQIWGNGEVYPYAMWLSEEVVEDEIDPSKNQEYLEKIAIKVVENHIENMLTMNEGTVAKNLKWWFLEAKKQI